MHPFTESEKKSRLGFWLVLLRGMIGRCPRCAGGRLFKRYLKPVEHCAACGESLGHIRADDGPAWLTIIVVGHIMAPILLTVAPESAWPDWLSLTVWPLCALALSLLILPRAKGIFVAIIWRSQFV